MTARTLRFSALILCSAAWLAGAPASAAPCGNDGSGFNPWLAAFKREAAAAGISQKAIAAGLNGVTYDAGVIKSDRSQRHFKQSFEQFAGKRVTSGRINKGRSLLQQNASLFQKIEKRFGVPGPILVAIWALETDFGAVSGNKSTIRSLATLAYDCRRSDFFTKELLAALAIVQRGDLSPAQMKGGWAGELGQTQFLPSSYVRFAVDFDGDGRRDLLRSRADVLASTANYLAGYGWQRGGSWAEGTANARVLRGWNKADVYARTIGLLATRIAGG